MTIIIISDTNWYVHITNNIILKSELLSLILYPSQSSLEYNVFDREVFGLHHLFYTAGWLKSVVVIRSLLVFKYS